MSNTVLSIESLDLSAQGVAHDDEGKVVFVEGALPGEKVRVEFSRHKKNYNKAQVVEVLQASPLRVTPRCPYFGQCGGCVMQHLDADAQIAIKQRALEDMLRHIGRVQAAQILPPIYGAFWGYRMKARFSARFVAKKGGMLVGFRERNSRFVMDMEHCQVVPPHVSALLKPLRALLETLSVARRVPQIELAVGDAQTVLVLRHLEPLSAEDHDKLRQFAQEHQIQWWLQPKGPETAHPLEADQEDLYYSLPEYDLQMHFKPTDFTQVNHGINRVLIRRALALLDIQPHHRVVDLFCGLGNFTLPIARTAREVVGVEGSEVLIERARAAAQKHDLADRAQFSVLDLFQVDEEWLQTLGHFDRMLIDPPRDGAVAVAKAVSALPVQAQPERIVYVSCNPSTLARDAGILTHVGGYRLQAAGVVNMFPHTAHIESIAVFTKGTQERLSID
ncbi:MAG TPA: 23S rRNA (uracil(1939)-C(5))-methyltransferase RlmD [Paenalcaligenes sp.]|nr:23S rRNA (uracil(1939)-C(5))-methyltransferase RlmD [Paenalcaligenes sp.]